MFQTTNQNIIIFRWLLVYSLLTTMDHTINQHQWKVSNHQPEHSLWIQTLSEKVLKPPNYSKLYPKHFLRRYGWIHRDL